jgi:hypothetical protein
MGEFPSRFPDVILSYYILKHCPKNIPSNLTTMCGILMVFSHLKTQRENLLFA